MQTPKRTDIPIGRINAVNRTQLAAFWGCGDRAARQFVAAFRAEPSSDGYVILSTAHAPAGYWRSADPEELTAFICENEARARNTFVALREAKRLLHGLQHEGQTALDLYGEVSR